MTNDLLKQLILPLLRFSLLLIILGTIGLFYAGFTHDKALGILAVIFYDAGCFVTIVAWLIIKFNWR